MEFITKNGVDSFDSKWRSATTVKSRDVSVGPIGISGTIFMFWFSGLSLIIC